MAQTGKDSRSSQLLAVKSQLLERKAHLEQRLKELSQEKVSDDQVQDPGDEAFSLTMEALRSSLQNAEFEEYTMIQKALDAIENGTYGICIDCGEQISPVRLKHYPNATRCIACQEAAEKA
ncbi:TraR/DksA C4-type zinc finger protein [Candidatus Dependentiae bacterium]|nr:TraR/DksA C4-type zinc finger protein [Candidatus Dependentiae bacterium]